jgi:hypothetical protein
MAEPGFRRKIDSAEFLDGSAGKMTVHGVVFQFCASTHLLQAVRRPIGAAA